MKRTVVVNDSLLLVTAAIWGLAFVAQRVGMDFIGPFTFNGIRFLLGGALLLPIVALLRRKPGRSQSGPAPAIDSNLYAWGFVAGLVLFAAASLQQIGLVYTTAGNAGFITGLYVVIVPLLGIGRRQSVGAVRWFAVAIAVIGLYLLAVPGHVQINPGDLFVLGSAFFFALHVQLVDHVAKRVASLPFAVVQYAVVGVLSLVVAILFEQPDVPSIQNAMVPILYGGAGSISVAYTLQVVAQRNAPATHAAILLSLEGTFAAVGGWMILAETLSPRGLTGCGLMLAAMLMSQFDRRRDAIALQSS